MLQVCNNPGVLDALDGFRIQHPGQVRIGSEALPVATTEGRPAERSRDGAQGDVGPFDTELPAHLEAPPVGQVPVPAGADVDAARVRVGKVGGPHTVSRILKAEARPSQPWDTAGVAAARVGGVGVAARDVELLLERHLAHQCLRGAEGRLPAADALGMGCMGQQRD